jgi:hypothetical protein
MNELCRLHRQHLVPLPLAHDACISRPQIKRCIGIGFADDAQLSGNHIQDFVAVRVHFAPVRRISGYGNEAYGHAIDPLRRSRPGGSGRDGEIAAQIQDKASDIDWDDLIHNYLAGTFLPNEAILLRATRLVVTGTA